MKSITLFILAFLISHIVISQQNNVADTFLLFYLGGQSNMDGYGFNSDLPETLNKEFQNVWIFHGNSSADGAADGGLGIWEPLKPGHGFCFTSDGIKNELCDRFGVELSFAARLQELYPGKKIALIKYSRGGTSIDSLAADWAGCWDPDFRGSNGINQYDHFLTTVRKALAVNDVDGDGREDLLVPSGIIWMQGESDGYFTEDIASRYCANLKRLMDLQRAAFRMDDLPVAIGKITDSYNDEDGKVWPFGELVQHAQEKFVAGDGHAAIVRSTQNYSYSDPYHYDSKGYIDLGKKFAEAVDSFLIYQ